MRILHLDYGREMRGGQHQALSLIQGLVSRGHECRLLARSDGALLQQARLLSLDAGALTWTAVWKESRKADIVHAHDARTHTLASIASAQHPVVSRRVAFPVSKGMLSRWKYAHASRYLAVSQFVSSQLQQAGVPEALIRIVPDGVSVPQKFTEGNRVVALATTDPQKGTDLLHEAMRGAPWSVTFSKDLACDLPQARVFVYITRMEGLGSAALLAMAHGVPVLASRVGGLPEIVLDGETGLLTGNEPQSIREKLTMLLQRPEWARQLGRQGRELVQRRYTLDHMVSATESAYRELHCS